MKTATEIIEKLYKIGSITFEEALTLGIKTEMDDKITNLKSLLPNLTADDLVQSLYDKSIEELDVQKCIDYMHSVNWTWNGNSISYGDFTNTLKTCISDVVYQMLDYIKENHIAADDVDKLGTTDKWFRSETGGINALGYFDEIGCICVETAFSIDKSTAYLSNFDVDDVIEVALKR